jgi:hypothetical protein
LLNAVSFILLFVLPLRSKYSPHLPVFRHPQSVFFPQGERPSSTPIQNNKNYRFVYFNSSFQTGDRKTKDSELNGTKNSANFICS